MAKKIVIVDDSEVNLLLINSLFEDEENINVYLEKDSTKALSLIKKQLPELIILDLMMPKVDGFQILKQLQDDIKLKSIPVLIITARQDKATYEKVMSYHVADYIKKPIDLIELETRIRKLIKVPATTL